jgi:hypothetical protein
VGLLCVFVAASAGSAHAQVTEGQGWHVAVDFLSVSTRGNDVHVGDVYTEHQTLSGTVAQSRLDYGVTYEPILANMESDPGWMVNAGYRGRRWGAGGRVWRAVAEGASEGADSTLAPTATSQYLTGIRMWENSIVPVTNMQEASGFSPVTFFAENRLEHLRIDGYAELRWTPGPSLNLAARFGLSHSRMDNTRREGQTQRAYVVQTFGATTSTLTNNISIDSESASTMSLTGPLVALAGDTTFGRVRLDWLVGQSTLIGTAETEGEWTDLDLINEVTVTSGIRTETSTVLDGVIPIEKDERTVVPVVDLQVRASVRVTGRVFVGAGVFSSTLFGVPVAPAFVIPDDWTDVQGTGWRQQNRNLTFTGLSIFAGVGF